MTFYSIHKNRRGKQFLCVANDRGLSAEDREQVRELVGNLPELSEGVWECDDPNLGKIMANSQFTEGGRAKIVLDYMKEVGYLDYEDKYEDDEDDE